MGFLGKIGSALFGGGGGKGYKPSYLQQNENAAQNILGNRTGAAQMANPNYKAGSQKPGEQQFNYDYSNAGKKVYGSESGGNYNVGGQSYDMNPINEAIAGYRNPSQSTAKYDPYKFNFQDRPQQYFDQAYEQGAKGIRREGAGNLQQIQSAIGTRRPGLLLKSAQQNARDVGEQEATLRSSLGQEQMRLGSELGRDQQMAQAGENQNAAGFNRDVERGNMDQVYRYLQGLQGAGESKLSAQSSALGEERNYEDNGLQYLLQLLQGDKGVANQGAQVNQQRQAGIINGVGGIAGIAKGLFK